MQDVGAALRRRPGRERELRALGPAGLAELGDAFPGEGVGEVLGALPPEAHLDHGPIHGAVVEQLLEALGELLARLVSKQGARTIIGPPSSGDQSCSALSASRKGWSERSFQPASSRDAGAAS